MFLEFSFLFGSSFHPWSVTARGIIMAEELEELWKKLSFTKEEDEGIELGSGSTKAAKERGKNCAILKVLS